MIRLLLTSGRGPAECRIAVAHALRRLAAEAEAMHCGAAIAEDGHAQHGPASAIVVLDGPAAADLAQRWTAGSILWVSQSPLRPRHGRKNWFIGVVALPATEQMAELASADIRFESFRAGGPGGQHQNKTESAVRAVDPSITILAAWAGEAIVAGCVLNRDKSDVVGLSNLFAAEPGHDRHIAAAIDYAADLAQDSMLVSYESGDDLARMRACGFHSAGPLRVWV
jgi:hypothetical protein